MNEIENLIRDKTREADFAALADIFYANDFTRGKAYLPRLAEPDFLAFLRCVVWYAKDEKAASIEFM